MTDADTRDAPAGDGGTVITVFTQPFPAPAVAAPASRPPVTWAPCGTLDGVYAAAARWREDGHKATKVAWDPDECHYQAARLAPDGLPAEIAYHGVHAGGTA